MSLIDTIAPRGRGRPPKSDLTPVQEALAQPLPAGIHDAVASVGAARESLNRAQAALDEHQQGTPATFAVEAARKAAEKASVRRQLADQLGDDDDAPAAEEVEKLQKAYSDAVALVNGKEARSAAFKEEIDRRRQALDQAHLALDAKLKGWRRAVVRAVEAQLAVAVQLAGEAQMTLYAVEPWRNVPSRMYLSSAESEIAHAGPERAELTAESAGVMDAWRRGQRVLLRT